ncbi:MAG: ATPase [Sphaerospermopsis sp. SIO1G1]|nr:ATPase [Sphaerospermopsis sp. SIO1G1]
MKSANELNLTAESTLRELPVWTDYLELDHPGYELSRMFEQNPLLPGVILTRDRECVGMISRRLFFEQMSRPYGLGLFAGRPVEYLYNFLLPDLFILHEETSIVDANKAALERSAKLVYEPIVVVNRNFQYGLLDFHQLLLAYSQVHLFTASRLRTEKERVQRAKADFRDLQQNYTRLLQNEKMIALGQLVAGIAHEVNNPINFIYGNISYASEYVQELLFILKSYQQNKAYPDIAKEAQKQGIDIEFLMDDLPKVLSSMKVGATRISEIVVSLRNFSRLDQAELKFVDIHEGIENTLIILKHNLKPRPDRPEIQIIREYSNLPLVECYAGQLNQVFMNIISNAIDALSEAYKISVGDDDHRARSKVKRDLKIYIQSKLIDNNHIMVRIGDNGLGIPKNIQAKLFDPFFTTKPVGKGTGLGLSISHQIIVEKHCGDIHCISNPGKGAEFIIKIPIKAVHKEHESLLCE